MTVFTADLCDTHPDKVSVLGPGYSNYGGATSCFGQVVTIKLDRNNADLITLLRDEDGQGKVVVVDSEQAYFAIVGEMLMKYSQQNGYAGIILNGYVRDTVQIQDIPVALYAMGTCSRKSIPVTKGQRDIPLSFGGIDFTPGDYVYADHDGVIVTNEILQASG